MSSLFLDSSTCTTNLASSSISAHPLSEQLPIWQVAEKARSALDLACWYSLVRMESSEKWCLLYWLPKPASLQVLGQRKWSLSLDQPCCTQTTSSDRGRTSISGNHHKILPLLITCCSLAQKALTLPDLSSRSSTFSSLLWKVSGCYCRRKAELEQA